MKSIDKSKLMKRAWKIYNSSLNRDTLSFDLTFSESLKKAWSLEKRDAAWKPEEKKPVDVFQLLADAIKPSNIHSGLTQQAYDQFYSGARYFGD